MVNDDSDEPGAEVERTSARDTLTGATRLVFTTVCLFHNIAQPFQHLVLFFDLQTCSSELANAAKARAQLPTGQTSVELHHDGQHHRKRQREGLTGLTSRPNNGPAVGKQHNRLQIEQLQGSQPERGGKSTGQPAAEDRLPETAEAVAADTNHRI